MSEYRNREARPGPKSKGEARHGGDEAARAGRLMRVTDSLQGDSTRQSESVDGAVMNAAPRVIGQKQMACALNQSAAPVAQARIAAALRARANPAQRFDAMEAGQQGDGLCETTQRVTPEEEEPLQGRFETVQRQGELEEDQLLQGRFASGGAIADPVADTEPTENRTGMPDRLKAGVEALSGMDMSDVRVHLNSDRPAGVNALAFAQGNDIHLAPGQEQHLPHEAWHVVQQREGRVQPTISVGGMGVNDDPGLESEADAMGVQALQRNISDSATLRNGSAMNPCVSNDAPRRLGIDLPAQRVGGGVIQLKSEATVKQEMRDGALLANIQTQFAAKHVGLGQNTNMSAIKVHANRDAPPKTNTVIKSARALKDEVTRSPFVSRVEGWSVTTKNPLELIETTRKDDQIQPVLGGPVLLNGGAIQPEQFVVEEGEIVDINGVAVDAAELETARKAAGKYPSKKDRRRAYRESLIENINDGRTRAHADAEALWVRTHFSKINDEKIPDNAGTSEINGIKSREASVTVFISEDKGEIWHLDGTD